MVDLRQVFINFNLENDLSGPLLPENRNLKVCLGFVHSLSSVCHLYTTWTRFLVATLRGRLHGAFSAPGLNSAQLNRSKFFAVTWTILTLGLKAARVRKSTKYRNPFLMTHENFSPMLKWLHEEIFNPGLSSTRGWHFNPASWLSRAESFWLMSISSSLWKSSFSLSISLTLAFVLTSIGALVTFSGKETYVQNTIQNILIVTQYSMFQCVLDANIIR